MDKYYHYLPLGAIGLFLVYLVSLLAGFVIPMLDIALIVLAFVAMFAVLYYKSKKFKMSSSTYTSLAVVTLIFAVITFWLWSMALGSVIAIPLLESLVLALQPLLTGTTIALVFVLVLGLTTIDWSKKR